MREEARRRREEAQKRREKEAAGKEKEDKKKEVNDKMFKKMVYGLIMDKYNLDINDNQNIDIFFEDIKGNNLILKQNDTEYHLILKEEKYEKSDKVKNYNIFAYTTNPEDKILVHIIKPACPCRFDQGFKYGWCGFAGWGGSIPACDH